uniref:Uncharacterized protein n=1 Tax=Paenibacillus athensensis TaxID=1967502 RepID=A0A4Y8PRK9_9BACL
MFIMNVPGIAGEACWFVDQGLRVRGKPVEQERIQPQRTEGAKDCGAMGVCKQTKFVCGIRASDGVAPKSREARAKFDRESEGEPEGSKPQAAAASGLTESAFGSAACRVASPCAGALADWPTNSNGAACSLRGQSPALPAGKPLVAGR